MAASKQASKQANIHTREQCSPASVGLAQARPNQPAYKPSYTDKKHLMLKLKFVKRKKNDYFCNLSEGGGAF